VSVGKRGGARPRKAGRDSPTKASIDPEKWREILRPARVYEQDQCLPGAFQAALISSDVLFGTTIMKDNDRQAINRRLEYKKDHPTAPEAPHRRRFTRWVEGHGLSVMREGSDVNALAHLRSLVDSDDSSLPVVAVDLRFVSDYDPNSKITGEQSGQDHAIVVLRLGEEIVEFFDPTFNPTVTRAKPVSETVALDRFIDRWANDPVEVYYRAWITRRARVAPPPAEERIKSRPSLLQYGVKGGGG
jgi:hypothetical protein